MSKSIALFLVFLLQVQSQTATLLRSPTVSVFLETEAGVGEDKAPGSETPTYLGNFQPKVGTPANPAPIKPVMAELEPVTGTNPKEIETSANFMGHYQNWGPIYYSEHPKPALLETETDAPKPAADHYQPSFLELMWNFQKPQFQDRVPKPADDIYQREVWSKYDRTLDGAPMTINSAAKLVFGPHYHDYNSFWINCKWNQQGTQEEADHDVVMGALIRNKNYCYTDNPQAGVWDAIYNMMIDDYMKAWFECSHEKSFDTYDRFLRALFAAFDYLGDLIDRVDSAEAAKKRYANSNEGKVAAKPADGSETKQRMEQQGQDFVTWVGDLTKLKMAIRNICDKFHEQELHYFGDKQKMSNKEIMKRFDNDFFLNFLQLIQVISDYAEFWCQEGEQLKPHFAKTLPVWNDLFQKLVDVVSDDQWPDPTLVQQHRENATPAIDPKTLE